MGLVIFLVHNNSVILVEPYTESSSLHTAKHLTNRYRIAKKMSEHTALQRNPKSKKGRGLRRFRRRHNKKVSHGPLDEDDCSSTASTTASSVVHDHPARKFNAESIAELEDELKFGDDSFFDNGLERFLVSQFTGSNSGLFAGGPNREVLCERITTEYKKIMFGDTDIEQSAVNLHLAASSQVLNGFLSFNRRSSYSGVLISSRVRRDIYQELESFLLPRMSYHYASTMDHLTPGETAEMITWIHHFLVHMEMAYPDIEISPAWKLDNERLLEHYIEQGVRLNLQKLTHRSLMLQASDDVRQNREGRVITNHPENVILMLDTQLEVAKSCLPAPCMQVVFASCAEVFSGMVSEIMLEIETSWTVIGSSRYCAFINDAVRLADLIDERIAMNPVDDSCREKVEALTRDLTQLSMHATRFLCERVIFDLKYPEGILTSIGRAEWETFARGEAVAVTIATLKDYFEDLERWIASDFYFPKILKTCFDLTLKTYVESFFANTSANGVKRARHAAEALAEDYSSLVAFFNGDIFEDYYGRGGFYGIQELNSRLHILKSISNVIEPTNEPEDLLQDVLAVSREFHRRQNDAPAILHLAGLRRRNNAKESISWLRVIARTDAALSEELEEAKTFNRSYRLPDLRNSKFLQNVKLDKARINKEVSARSISAVKRTGKLLQTRNRRLRAVKNPFRRNKVYTPKSV